jgi:hypothetical protein
MSPHQIVRKYHGTNTLGALRIGLPAIPNLESQNPKIFLPHRINNLQPLRSASPPKRLDPRLSYRQNIAEPWKEAR